jgi:predicted CXXCH cytochrome family protein
MNRPKYKNCLICGKEYFCRSRWKYETSKYCSNKCQHIGISIIKSGKKPYQMTDKTRKKISEAKTGVKIWGGKRTITWLSGNDNPNWRGDEVGYYALHHWINRVVGKAVKCSICGSSGGNIRKCHWANISKEYKRMAEDYISLCPKCHKQYDLGRLALNEQRRIYGYNY